MIVIYRETLCIFRVLFCLYSLTDRGKISFIEFTTDILAKLSISLTNIYMISRSIVITKICVRSIALRSPWLSEYDSIWLKESWILNMIYLTLRCSSRVSLITIWALSYRTSKYTWVFKASYLLKRKVCLESVSSKCMSENTYLLIVKHIRFLMSWMMRSYLRSKATPHIWRKTNQNCPLFLRPNSNWSLNQILSSLWSKTSTMDQDDFKSIFTDHITPLKTRTRSITPNLFKSRSNFDNSTWTKRNSSKALCKLCNISIKMESSKK